MQQKVATLALISTYQFKSKTSRKEKALVNAHAIFDKENGYFTLLQQHFFCSWASSIVIWFQRQSL